MLDKALGINFPNIIDRFMSKNSIIIVVEEYQKNKEEVARNQGTNTIVWNLKKKKNKEIRKQSPEPLRSRSCQTISMVLQGVIILVCPARTKTILHSVINVTSF